MRQRVNRPRAAEEVMITSRAVIVAVLTLSLQVNALAQSSPAKAPPVALKGYDPVSYFDPGKPAKGVSTINYDFDGMRYLFVSQKNRELFAGNPDRYSPQFRGLCTTGVSMGVKAGADPNIFLVKDGKLYVFSDIESRAMVEKDPTLLTKAHQAWGQLKK
jgi:YHS domain-containing protein